MGRFSSFLVATTFALADAIESDIFKRVGEGGVLRSSEVRPLSEESEMFDSTISSATSAIDSTDIDHTDHTDQGATWKIHVKLHGAGSLVEIMGDWKRRRQFCINALESTHAEDVDEEEEIMESATCVNRGHEFKCASATPIKPGIHCCAGHEPKAGQLAQTECRKMPDSLKQWPSTIIDVDTPSKDQKEEFHASLSQLLDLLNQSAPSSVFFVRGDMHDAVISAAGSHHMTEKIHKSDFLLTGMAVAAGAQFIGSAVATGAATAAGESLWNKFGWR